MLIIAVAMKDEVQGAKLCFADPKTKSSLKASAHHRQRLKIHGNMMSSLAPAYTSTAASL